VIVGTPIDLSRFLKINTPILRARYELQEVGQPTLEDLLKTRFPRNCEPGRLEPQIEISGIPSALL
jgi:predicted GTPase